MKTKLFLILALFFCFSYKIVPHTIVFAHPDVLDVEYDVCQPTKGKEGEDELWYLLYRPLLGYDEYLHLSEDITTIRYFFSDCAKNNPDYTWTTDVSKEIAQDIQNAFAKSLCKWNEVAYYTYDQEGNRIRRQLITVEEGTKENYNLLIYPTDATAPYIASTAPLSAGTEVDTQSSILHHIHCDKWYMNVNLHYFYENQDVSPQTAFINKERIGMHELGHVLGLRDIDLYCSSNDHHEELLMGYGNELDCQLSATYQDIAGIAITRGFHTDADHIWMKRVNLDNSIDLICAICNGVIYDVKTFENHMIDYQSCNHYGEDFGRMLLVASVNHYDYFKCQGCRHIDTIEFVEEYDIKDDSRIKDTRIINSLSKIYYKLNVECFQYYQMIANSYETVHITLYDENLEIIDPQMKEESDITKNREYALSKGIYYLEVDNAKNNKDVLTLDIYAKNPIHSILDHSINILLNVYKDIYQNDFRLYHSTLSQEKQEECLFLNLPNISISDIKNSKEKLISMKESFLYQENYQSTINLQDFTRGIWLDDSYINEIFKNQYKYYSINKDIVIIFRYSTMSSKMIRRTKKVVVNKKNSPIVWGINVRVLEDKKSLFIC